MMCGKRRRVGEHHGRINFALSDQFDDFTIFFLSARGNYRARGGFRLEHCWDIRLLTLYDKVVDDQVSKNVAIKAVRFSGVKRP